MFLFIERRLKGLSDLSRFEQLLCRKTGIKITVFLILKTVLLFLLEICETLAGELGHLLALWLSLSQLCRTSSKSQSRVV